jgi:hypothetical protein
VLGQIALVLWMGGLPQSEPPPRAGCEGEAFTPQARESALAEFARRIDEYVQLHRRLEAGLPAEEPFDDPHVMLESARSLAKAIRHARKDARPGDIFTACPARLFRAIIANTLSRDRRDAREVIRSLNDERLPGATHPVVNGRYDWRLGAWMWPALLVELPALPRELEYRIVDEDLLLIDLRANLVVDILENAMPVGDE